MTKIKTDHIRALDSGDYDNFPATVYIRGFVRAYATMLKLNVPQVLAALAAELANNKKFCQKPKLSRESDSWFAQVVLQIYSMNWRKLLSLLLLGGLLAGAIFGFRAWQARNANDPLADMGTGLYQSKQKNPGELVPLPK